MEEVTGSNPVRSKLEILTIFISLGRVPTFADGEVGIPTEASGRFHGMEGVPASASPREGGRGESPEVHHNVPRGTFNDI